MSRAAYWAARPLDKLLLLAFAHHVDATTGECFPSVAALCEWAGCDRKTAMKSTASLEAAGLLIDTGRRRGKTGQVKVYRLPVETVPETGPLNSTVFPAKESQKRDTEQPKEHTSSKTSSSQKKRARPTPPFELPDWVPKDAWDGWIEMRQANGAKPTTKALNLAIDKLKALADDGHPPGEVLDQSTFRLWTGLFPIKDNRNDQSRSFGRSPATRSAQRDAIAAAYDRVDFG